MRMPGADKAVVDIAKLRDYCLNPLHPRGRLRPAFLPHGWHSQRNEPRFFGTRCSRPPASSQRVRPICGRIPHERAKRVRDGSQRVDCP